MANMMSRSQSGRSAFRTSRPRPAVARAPVAARRVQRSTVQVQAFFNFLAPKQAGAAASPKAKELSDALLEIASQTKPGSAVSPVTKAEIEELVAELEPLCMKNPLKSPLLWGTYDVVYCSKPSAVGGPLTKGAGPVLAAGQQARQILQDDGTLINEVSFKTLGLLPGFSRQYGQIQPLSGDTFLLSIKEGEISTGLVKQTKEFDIERKIKIVYLDDNLRIARFLPSEDLSDSEQEAAEGGPEDDEILFVFQRVAEQEEEEEEEEVDEEEEDQRERATSPIANLFGGTRKVESLATQAERRVQEQRTRKGTQPFFIGGRGRDVEEEEEEQEDPRAARARAQAERRAEQERAKQEAASARAQDQARAAKERERAEREKDAERARAQREKEAEERARAQQEARERAEAEKVARAERQAQIRELLAELGDELKDKQVEAREAAKEARDVARENQAVLRQVSQAEAAIAEAEQDVQQVSAALEEAAAARKSVEQQFKAAQQAVREAEAAYKQKVGAR